MAATGSSSSGSDTSAARLDQRGIHAILADLVGATLDLSPDEVASLEPDRSLDGHDLGVDSLHLIELATRVSALFALHEIGVEDALLRRRRLTDWTGVVQSALAHPAHTGLMLQTSGSAGAPVQHHHAWPDLEQEIDVLAEVLADRRRVVAMVPRHHIYGLLFGVMLPRRLGIDAIDARPGGPLGMPKLLQPGDLVVSVPLLWRHMLELRVTMPHDVVGVTSTGPCPREVAVGLAEQGLARLVEVYGSTDTGGIGWRDDPDLGFRWFRHWATDGHGDLLRTGVDGRIRRVAPPDRLVALGDGFLVAGRRDKVVQVAGTNVSPSKIAETLRGHPAIAECAVRLMRPDEGDRLKAYVVLTDGADVTDLRPALRRWLFDVFAAPERPASLTFGPALPRDANGKTVDWDTDRSSAGL